MRKITAGIIAFIFFFTGSVSGADYRIPSEYGKVAERHNVSGGSKKVILIQDAHTVFEAQKNIALLIKSFVKQGNILVAVEGASGELDFNEIRLFPYKSILRSVAGEYLADGKIVAGEYAKLIADKDFILYGAEDFALFRDDFSYFYSVGLSRAELENEIVKVEEILSDLRKKTFNKELYAFDEKLRKSGDVKDILPAVYEYSDRLGIDLFNYINLLQFKEIIFLEDSINYSELRRELEIITEKRFGDNISNNSEMAKLVNSVIGKWIDCDAYPNVKKFYLCEKKRKIIDYNKFLDEIYLIGYEIRKKLCERDDEYELVKTVKAYEDFKKVLFLNIRRFELGSAEGAMDRVEKFFSKNYPEKINFSILRKHLKTANAFYEKAKARDAAIAENLVNKMNSTGVDIAMLVAGGFHKDGLIARFRDLGVNVVCVIPNIVEVKDDIPYFDRMSGKLFRISPVFVSSIQVLGLYVSDSLRRDINLDLVARLISMIAIYGYDEDKLRNEIMKWRNAYINDENVGRIIDVIFSDKEKIIDFARSLESFDTAYIRAKMSESVEFREFMSGIVKELEKIYAGINNTSNVVKKTCKIKVGGKPRVELRKKVSDYLRKFIVMVLIFGNIGLWNMLDTAYRSKDFSITMSVCEYFDYSGKPYSNLILNRDMANMFNILLNEKDMNKVYNIMYAMENNMTKKDFLYFIGYIAKNYKKHKVSDLKKLQRVISILSNWLEFKVKEEHFSDSEKRVIIKVVTDLMLENNDYYFHTCGYYILEKCFGAEGVENIIKVLESGATTYGKFLENIVTGKYYPNLKIYNAIHIVENVDEFCVGKFVIQRVNEALIRLVAHPSDDISRSAFNLLISRVGREGIFEILSRENLDYSFRISILKRMVSKEVIDKYFGNNESSIYMYGEYMDLYGKYGDEFDKYVILGLGNLGYYEEVDRSKVIKLFENIIYSDKDILLKKYAALMLLEIGDYSLVKEKYDLFFVALKEYVEQQLDIPLHYGYFFKMIMENIGSDDLYAALLPRVPDAIAGGLSFDNMKCILDIKEFREITSNMNVVERIIFARTIELVLRRFDKEVNINNVKVILPLLYKEREKQFNRVLFDSSIKAVVALHDDKKMFKPDEIKTILQKVGNNIINDNDIIIGPKGKEAILDKISDPKYNLIWFDGHGGPEHFWLTSGEVGFEISDNMHLKEAISYVEIAEALKKRVENGGDLSKLVIMMDSCYSSDSVTRTVNKLVEILRNGKVNSLPLFVVVAGHGALGHGSEFKNVIKESIEEGNKVKIRDLNRLKAWKLENIFVFVPTSDEFWNKLEGVLSNGEDNSGLLEKLIESISRKVNGIELLKPDIPMLEVKNRTAKSVSKVATLPETYKIAYKVNCPYEDVSLKLAPFLETFGIFSKFILRKELAKVSWFDRDLWAITLKSSVAVTLFFGISYLLLGKISFLVSFAVWNLSSIFFGLSHSDNKLKNIVAGYVFNMPLLFPTVFFIHRAWNKNNIVSEEKDGSVKHDETDRTSIAVDDAVVLNEEIQNIFLRTSGEYGLRKRIENIIANGDTVNLFVTRELEDKLVENRSLLHRLNMFGKLENVNLYYEKREDDATKLLGNVNFEELAHVDRKNLVILSHVGDEREYDTLVYEFNFLDEEAYIHNLVLFEAVITELMEIATGRHKFANPYLVIQGKANLIRLNNELIVKRKLIPAIVKLHLYNKFIKSAA